MNINWNLNDTQPENWKIQVRQEELALKPIFTACWALTVRETALKNS